MAEFAVILFHSTSHAIHAERVLKKAGLTVKLIPTPRELSSDRGSALRIAAGDQGRSAALLAEANVSIDRIERFDR